VIVNSLALAAHTFGSKLPHLLTVADSDLRCSTVFRIVVLFAKFRYLANPVTRPVKDCRANDKAETCEVPYAWSCARQAVGSCPEWCIGNGHQCFVVDLFGQELPQRCQCSGTSPLRWTVIAASLMSVLCILCGSLSQAYSWRGRLPFLGLSAYVTVSAVPQGWLLFMILRLVESTAVISRDENERDEWHDTDTFKLAFLPVLFSELLANECNCVLGRWFETDEGHVPLYTVISMTSSGIWLLRPITVAVVSGCALVAFLWGRCLDLAVVLSVTALAAFLIPGLLNLTEIANSRFLRHRVGRRRAQVDAMLQDSYATSTLPEGPLSSMGEEDEVELASSRRFSCQSSETGMSTESGSQLSGVEG